MFRFFKYLPIAAALACALPQAASATSVLTLDPFTGASFKTMLATGYRDTIQSGQMMGGYRVSRLTVNPHAYRQSATLQGRSSGPLLVSNGYKSYHRVELRYGVDGNGANSPMNFDFSPFDRVVLDLEGQNTVLNVNVVLYSNGGASYAQAAHNVDINIAPHRVEFLFSDFSDPSGAFDIRDVDYAVVIIQSASAVGGDDYAVVRLSLEGP